MYQFNPCCTASIKAIAIKEHSKTSSSTQFSTGKMLMLAKLSLMSFIYELTESFMFPSEKIKYIYDMYNIDFVYVWQLLTDTGSTSLQLVFFTKENRKVPEDMFRFICFLVIINSKILERFDISDKFWQQFGVRNEKTRKQLGLFNIENIDDPCFITIATKPKEYIEYFKSEHINKKHKGIKKSEKAMNLESFTSRITSLGEIEKQENKFQNATIEQSRFTIQKMK